MAADSKKVNNELLINPDETEIAKPDPDYNLDDLIKQQQQSDVVSEAKETKVAKPMGKLAALAKLSDIAKKHKNPDELLNLVDALKPVDSSRVLGTLRRAAKTVKKAKDLKKTSKASEKPKLSATGAPLPKPPKDPRKALYAEAGKLSKIHDSMPEDTHEQRAKSPNKSPRAEFRKKNLMPLFDQAFDDKKIAAIRKDVNSAEDLPAAEKIFDFHFKPFAPMMHELVNRVVPDLHPNDKTMRYTQFQYDGGGGKQDQFSMVLRNAFIKRRRGGTSEKEHLKAVTNVMKQHQALHSLQQSNDEKYQTHKPIKQNRDAAGNLNIPKVDVPKTPKPRFDPTPGNRRDINIDTSNRDKSVTSRPTMKEKLSALLTRIKSTKSKESN